MFTDLEQRVARYTEALDRDAPTVSFDDIVRRPTVTVDVDLPEHPVHDGASDVDGGSWIDPTPSDDQTRGRDVLIELAAASAARRPTWQRVGWKAALGAAAAAVFVIAVVAIERGGDELDTDTTTSPSLVTRGGWWPQSNPDEVRAAQELADAGDPTATWQLDADLAASEDPWGAQIFTRFIEDELGWEAFVGASFAGFMHGDAGGDIDSVLFIRCEPGQTNPLSRMYAEAPPEVRECAPTIDDLTYETVRFSVHQPGRRGPSGIWVVDTWEILQPRSDPGAPADLLYPDYFVQDLGPIEQAAPPSDASVSALLEAFLNARVEGEAAEQYLVGGQAPPLLYATTSGAPYARSEIQRLRGPVWPTGWSEYEVRLFAEGGTVVEQHFHVVSQADGQLGLLYGSASTHDATRENGQSVAVPHTVFLDTLTFTAPPLIPRGDGYIEAPTANGAGRVVIHPDPAVHIDGPGSDSCESGEAAADSAALVRSVMAVPGFETTEPVPVTVAGIDGLQMDVTFREASPCYGLWMRELPAGDPGWRMRLYLIDYPDDWVPPPGSDWSPEVLTIAVIAPESDFESVLEHARPIVESVELHSG